MLRDISQTCADTLEELDVYRYKYLSSFDGCKVFSALKMLRICSFNLDLNLVFCVRDGLRSRWFILKLTPMELENCKD